MSIFFTKYRTLSKKRTWFVTQIHVITKKSSTYTQGDYGGLSSGINIYIPDIHRFEKKLLMSAFFTKYRTLSKKRTWFVTQVHVITKKSSTYTQGDYSGLSYDINIYIPEYPPFWEKIAYVSIFYKISFLWTKKERDLSRKYTIITKKSSTYTQGDYSGLSYDINIYNPDSTFLRKNCLCQHFLQDIVLWAKKERDLSRKYRL